MYNKIFNPESGRMVSLFGKLGQKILKNYLSLLGGATQSQGELQIGDTIESIDQVKLLFLTDLAQHYGYEVSVRVFKTDHEGELIEMEGDWRLYDDEWEEDDDEKKLYVFDDADQSGENDLVVVMNKDKSKYKLIYNGMTGDIQLIR